jgi:Smg protein
MKENVLDVLMYLFENYLDETESQPDRESLTIELEEAGFPGAEITKAFDWLEALAAHQTSDPSAPLYSRGSMRVYSDSEVARLDAECRGLLLYLENMGVLDPAQREIVIDRIMALEAAEIDIEQVKWIILMVLFNQPGQELAFARMEDLVFDESVGLVH